LNITHDTTACLLNGRIFTGRCLFFVIGLVSSSNCAATAAAGDDYDGGGSDCVAGVFQT